MPLSDRGGIDWDFSALKSTGGSSDPTPKDRKAANSACDALETVSDGCCKYLVLSLSRRHQQVIEDWHSEPSHIVWWPKQKYSDAILQRSLIYFDTVVIDTYITVICMTFSESKRPRKKFWGQKVSSQVDGNLETTLPLGHRFKFPSFQTICHDDEEILIGMVSKGQKKCFPFRDDAKLFCERHHWGRRCR